MFQIVLGNGALLTKRKGWFFCLMNDEGRELLVVVKMLVTCPSHKEEGLTLSMEGGKREVCSLLKGDFTMLEG